MADFWTKVRAEAAQLVAEDRLTDDQIAARFQRTRRWLAKLKVEPQFQIRVGSIVADTAAALKAKGIADKQNRIDALNRDFDRLETVLVERGADPSMVTIPGGSTGAVVRQYKFARDGSTIEEYAVDTATIAERRALAKQAAQESGEWAEKRELTGKDGGPIKGEMSIMDLVLLAGEEDE